MKVLIVGADIDTAHLARSISKRLPRYMLPSEFRVVQALPLKPNGKVDRKKAQAKFDDRPTN